jgi:thiamine biosynthesis protein ThiI
MPIYRPLIGFDKVESEKLARRIGTFQASIASVEGCRAVPQKPATKARLDRVLKIEDDLKSLI